MSAATVKSKKRVFQMKMVRWGCGKRGAVAIKLSLNLLDSQ